MLLPTQSYSKKHKTTFHSEGKRSELEENLAVRTLKPVVIETYASEPQRFCNFEDNFLSKYFTEYLLKIFSFCFSGI